MCKLVFAGQNNVVTNPRHPHFVKYNDNINTDKAPLLFKRINCYGDHWRETLIYKTVPISLIDFASQYFTINIHTIYTHIQQFILQTFKWQWSSIIEQYTYTNALIMPELYKLLSITLV